MKANAKFKIKYLQIILHYAFCILHYYIFADVAERQTRWFQVPVSRDVWVQIPSSAPKQKQTLAVCFLFWGGDVVQNPLTACGDCGETIPLCVANDGHAFDRQGIFRMNAACGFHSRASRPS